MPGAPSRALLDLRVAGRRRRRGRRGEREIRQHQLVGQRARGGAQEGAAVANAEEVLGRPSVLRGSDDALAGSEVGRDDAVGGTTSLVVDEMPGAGSAAAGLTA